MYVAVRITTKDGYKTESMPTTLRMIGTPRTPRTIGRRILRKQIGANERGVIGPIAATDADVWPALALALRRPVFVFEDAARRCGQLYTTTVAPFGGVRAVYDAEADVAHGIDRRLPPATTHLVKADGIIVQRTSCGRRVVWLSAAPVTRRGPQCVRLRRAACRVLLAMRAASPRWRTIRRILALSALVRRPRA